MTRKPLPPSFLCPLCGLRSYHPKDVERRFCARCGSIDDVMAQQASRDKWEPSDG
jgi:ribosomal protein L37E